MSPPNLAEERFRVWLAGLGKPRLTGLSREYARLAFEGGLSVLRDGAPQAIPPALTAVVDEPERQRARADLAHRLLRGIVRTLRYHLGGIGRSEADALLAGLSPWERELCDLTWREGEYVAIARADLFTDSAGVDRPLEMNATIPAMQAYSDVAAQAFLRAVGGLAGLSRERIDALARRNGSNSDDLRRSLLAHHERLGGRGDGARMAMVARAQDPQSTELAALCRSFNAAGLEAHRCTPDQIGLDEQGRATLLGKPLDLIYRHVFARRIEPASALGRIAREPARHHLLNPVNSQLEMKSVFAELSAAAAEPALAHAIGFEPDELAAAATIPWSRRLGRAPTPDPSGAAVANLLAFAQANPRRLVLKRSWGYGGTSVLLGDEIETESGQQRARDILGTAEAREVSWQDLLEHCAQRGGYVVQERVELATQRHLVAGDGEPVWLDWYVDVSAYTNLGVEPRPTGAVRRGSKSRIVNIVGGGGLVPVILRPVMEELLEAVGV
ncbi:MAG TPA: hypothetical protein VMB50_10430 [Myxococcales bacterium]|nr:hypothetical protein [Myxococcales bacterium]